MIPLPLYVHTAPVDETIAQEALWEAIRTYRIDHYSEVTRWWCDGEEIENVGLAPESNWILFGEYKWMSDSIGEEVASHLEVKPSGCDGTHLLGQKSSFPFRRQALPRG